MQISKKNLLSLIENNIKEMAMDFDGEDRPSPEVQNKLAQGDTPLKKVPLPATGDEPNKNFQELLASERYRQVIQRVREYTGVQTPMRAEQGIMPLAMMMMDAHNQIVNTERNHREELENLAIELVMKEMGIPEGSLQFDAKIVGVGEIDTQDFSRDTEEQNIDPVDIEQDLMDDLGQLNLEKAKRRLINNMIQGASKKGHYMYHLVGDRIRQITGSENLVNQYGVLMSVNDTLYWQLSDEKMKMMMGGGGGEGAVAGKESVDLGTTPPTIMARGVNFPILVHELIKGIMELFAIQGRPEDEEQWSDVESSEDTLDKEMWDLRLGPAIWDRIRSQFPEEILVDENKVELQNYLLVEIFKLPARNFLILMKEVIGQTTRGKQLLDELMEGIYKMFNDQDYEDSVSKFRDNLEDLSNETSDDDLKSFLGNLGVSLSDDDDEDEDDEGGELVRVR